MRLLWYMSFMGGSYIENNGQGNWQHLGEGDTQALPKRIISGSTDLIFACRSPMLKEAHDSMLASIILMIVWVVVFFTGLILYLIRYGRRK